MKAIERAVEHFKSKETRVIEVLEWGEDGKPLKVFVEPMTLREKQRLYRNSKQEEMGVLIDAIILKAKDDQGNPLFTLEDKLKLMNQADSNVIARVAEQILIEQSIDELKKN